MGDSGAKPDPPEPNETILLMEVYHMADIFDLFGSCPFVGHGNTAVSEEGLYAELQRFHRSTEADLDDLEWKEGWNAEDA